LSDATSPIVIAQTIPPFTPERLTDRLAPLRAHLEANYHAPDLQAIEIVLCALVAHYYVQADPVWLFVEGRSRCGKTSCCINPMVGLPNVRMVGDLSPKTFLSGWKDQGKGKKKSTSLLTEIGSNGILLFKDFTTLMSKRPEQRAEIVAQMRELYDGRLSKNTGMGASLDWAGKITAIAAVTQAVEREWSLLRALGERFLTVRYRSEMIDDSMNARRAMEQRGKERDIAQKAILLVGELVDHKTLPSTIIHPAGEIMERLINLSRIVAMTRAQVIRVGNDIVDVPDYESPTGIAKALAAVVSARAALYRRDHITDGDLKLAIKLAMDSIPMRRAKILEWTPRNDTTTWGEIRKHTGQAPSSLKWHLDELMALGIMHKDEASVDDCCWGFTKSFQDLWDKALPDPVKAGIG
jgi:hypothetical protein